jgi:hypothetical protein
MQSSYSSTSSVEEKKDVELMDRIIVGNQQQRRATLVPSKSNIGGSLKPSWMNKEEVVPQELKLQKTF